MKVTWNDQNGREVNPKLSEERGHVPRLPVQLVLAVGQAEHAQLAVGELLPESDHGYTWQGQALAAPCCEDVGNEKSESSIVVKPPDVNRSTSLLCPLLELGNVPNYLLCQRPENAFDTTYLYPEEKHKIDISPPALVVLIHRS